MCREALAQIATSLLSISVAVLIYFEVVVVRNGDARLYVVSSKVAARTLRVRPSYNIVVEKRGGTVRKGG